MNVLPNAIVIGAMKCATTSLHYYLDLHPQVSMAAEKELHFFVAERNWSKGLAWYERQFAGRASVHGESSTSYTRFPHHAGVAERMHKVVPDAKLIYVVRDPVDRIVSHYVHEYAAGREHRTLTEALARLPGNPYLDFSRYHMQIEQYLERYPRERILILTAEDLYAQRAETMGRVYRFLGVGDSFRHPRLSVIKHRSREKRRLNAAGARLSWLPTTGLAQRVPPGLRRYAWRLLSYPFSSPVERPSLDLDVRGRLIDALRDDVDRLRRLTGDPFDAWLR